MKPSVINDRQEYEVLGEDVICNLSSTNVATMMQSPDFGKSIRVALRALNTVSEKVNNASVPTIENGNKNNHAVGLGAMNLHGFLAKNKIQYGSPESIEFTDIYFMLLNYWTLVESNNIAIETGETFADFDKSDYATGRYFERYQERIILEENIQNLQVTDLFKDIAIPTMEDWTLLQASIQEHGLFNSYRMAVAPTGSISYINESTASIHPIIQKVEERIEGSRGKVYYPSPYLSEETIPYYKSAYDIDQRRIIDVYAAAQKHVDQGLSLTIFTRSEFEEGMYEWKENSAQKTKKTTRDLNMFRNYAWTKGIKSLYYVRTFTDDGEVSSVEMCENCSI